MADDIYLRELCMLTGKMNKDKDYLYYLLVKDGSMFVKEKKVEVINDESTVDSFENWFNNL